MSIELPNLDYFYLASPYSTKDEELLEFRVKETRRAKVWLKKTMNWIVYSPIVHWHQTCKDHELPGDAQSWLLENYTMQRHAGGLIVACLAGWRESRGVNIEIDWALVLAQPIWTLVPLLGNEDFVLISVLGDPR